MQKPRPAWNGERGIKEWRIITTTVLHNISQKDRAQKTTQTSDENSHQPYQPEGLRPEKVSGEHQGRKRPQPLCYRDPATLYPPARIAAPARRPRDQLVARAQILARTELTGKDVSGTASATALLIPLLRILSRKSPFLSQSVIWLLAQYRKVDFCFVNAAPLLLDYKEEKACASAWVRLHLSN